MVLFNRKYTRAPGVACRGHSRDSQDSSRGLPGGSVQDRSDHPANDRRLVVYNTRWLLHAENLIIVMKCRESIRDTHGSDPA